MYQAEVLGKLPVMQHFYFGSILPYQGLPPPDGGDSEACAHGHVHSGPIDRAALGGWGDCCGIAVPSVFAAAAEEQRKQATGGVPVLKGAGIRPVPFD